MPGFQLVLIRKWSLVGLGFLGLEFQILLKAQFKALFLIVSEETITPQFRIKN